MAYLRRRPSGLMTHLRIYLFFALLTSLVVLNFLESLNNHVSCMESPVVTHTSTGRPQKAQDSNTEVAQPPSNSDSPASIHLDPTKLESGSHGELTIVKGQLVVKSEPECQANPIRSIEAADSKAEKGKTLKLTDDVPQEPLSSGSHIQFHETAEEHGHEHFGSEKELDHTEDSKELEELEIPIDRSDDSEDTHTPYEEIIQTSNDSKEIIFDREEDELTENEEDHVDSPPDGITTDNGEPINFENDSAILNTQDNNQLNPDEDVASTSKETKTVAQPTIANASTDLDDNDVKSSNKIDHQRHPSKGKQEQQQDQEQYKAITDKSSQNATTRPSPSSSTNSSPPTIVPTKNNSNRIPPRDPRSRLRNDRINYASAECGAKVLASNPEAMDASTVLMTSKDRYMLNPCSAPRQWLVIELCEEIDIDLIQMGNFEFFSSMIKEVQILGADNYPALPWYVLGNFTLTNERKLQMMDFGDEGIGWFKIIKINILSHWGNEYYCPISEIKVHGLPVALKLQSEFEDNYFNQYQNANGGTENNQATKDFGESEGILYPNSSPEVDIDQLIESNSKSYLEEIANYLPEASSQEPPKKAYNPSHLPSPSNSPQIDHITNNVEQTSSHYDFDVVRSSIGVPQNPIGDEDDLLDEEDPNGFASFSRPLPRSSSSSNSDTPMSTIPTIKLIQDIIRRVKDIEFSQNQANEKSFARLKSVIGSIQKVQTLLSNYTKMMDQRIHKQSVQAKRNEERLRANFEVALDRALRSYFIYSVIICIFLTLLFLIVSLCRFVPPSGPYKMVHLTSSTSMPDLRGFAESFDSSDSSLPSSRPSSPFPDNRQPQTTNSMPNSPILSHDAVIIKTEPDHTSQNFKRHVRVKSNDL